MKKILMVSALLGLSVTLAFAQGMPPGDNVIGKVTAVNGTTLTVAPITGGDPVTVKIVERTRVLKERQPVTAADIKIDDTIFVRGQRNGTSIDAGMVNVFSPEMVQRMQKGMAQMNREELGKKFITGEVKAINELKLTILRPDNQTQEIEVDENTSFRKGRESITLADIKVGDFVHGAGDLKEGVFIPKELIVGRPGIVMGFGSGGPGGAGRGGPGAMMDPADMGKIFIAGRVKAVQQNTITVSRIDQQTQDIQVDKNTVLKQMPGNSTITLADVKVGDIVRGPGELKDGVFVPRELTFNHPRNAADAGAEKPPNPAPPKN